MSNFLKSSCVVCKGFSQCSRCEIADLKNRIFSLENQIQFLTQSKNDLLEISKYDEMDILKYLMKSDKKDFQQLLKEGIILPELSHMKFITLTFDPNRFGVANNSEQEKQYFLHILSKCIRKEYMYGVYGCFEYQKNGTVHTHFITNIYSKDNETAMYKYLKSKLTNNPHNRVAVRIDIMKKTAVDYINKESTDYFISRPSIESSLDYDVNELT